MAITTILSDLGNVAVLFDNEKTVREFAALCGRTEDEVRAVLFRKGGALLRRYERGAVTTSEFRRTVCARLNLSKRELPPDEAFDAAWCEVFTPNVSVLDRWRALRSAGLTITAVSNIDELRERELHRIGLLSHFDPHVMSWSEKLRKPSEELMVRSLDRSGCSAEEALFVDDIEDNLKPAAKIGINVHHFISFDVLERHLETLGL